MTTMFHVPAPGSPDWRAIYPVPPQLRLETVGRWCVLDDEKLRLQADGWLCPRCGAAWSFFGDRGRWLPMAGETRARRGRARVWLASLAVLGTGAVAYVFGVHSRPWADRVPDQALLWASAGLSVAGGVLLLVGWLVGKIGAWPYRHNTSRRLTDAEAAEYAADRAARATATVTVEPLPMLLVEEHHRPLIDRQGRPVTAVEMLTQLTLQGRKTGMAIEAADASPQDRAAALGRLGTLLIAELAVERDLMALDESDVAGVVAVLAGAVPQVPVRLVQELVGSAVRICRVELLASGGPVDQEQVLAALQRCWALMMHGSPVRGEVGHA